jgi:hypothetical protein
MVRYGQALKYEGESVNRSQMDVKRKACDIRTWEKHLFLDISSTNIDTLVPSLYQCVETRSIKSSDCCVSTSAPPIQPLRHQLNVYYAVVNRFTRQTLPTIKRKYFYMNILWIELLCPQKMAILQTIRRCFLNSEAGIQSHGESKWNFWWRNCHCTRLSPRRPVLGVFCHCSTLVYWFIDWLILTSFYVNVSSIELIRHAMKWEVGVH